MHCYEYCTSTVLVALHDSVTDLERPQALWEGGRIITIITGQVFINWTQVFIISLMFHPICSWDIHTQLGPRELVLNKLLHLLASGDHQNPGKLEMQ